MTGGGSLLGQELDSLADLVGPARRDQAGASTQPLLPQISFGVAPATLAYTLGLRHTLDVAALLLFTSGGLARLARFNATVALIPTKSDGSSKYFTGLPIPSSLFLTATMAWFVRMGWFVGSNGYNFAKLKVGASANEGSLPFGDVTLFGEPGGWGQMHWLSIVPLVWGAMMVSKTLKVGADWRSRGSARG